ncbi:MFS transporter [Bacillus sp. JCM 19041]|uniref:MFS transporter n=1 Tax=Bacillus sp. JCM 19041 TaxID=1460637 RepID=UPI0006CFCB30
MNFSRLVLPGITMIAVTYGLARFSYGLLLPSMNNDLEMSSVVSGTISSLFYLSYCIAIVISMIYTPKKGPRNMIVAAGISAFIGLFIMAISPNVWVLGVGVLFSGASTGLASPPFGAAISFWIEQKKQGKANTWVNSGTSIGIVLTGAGAFILASEWRLTYFIYALIALLAVIWNWQVLPKTRPQPRVTSKKRSFSLRGIERILPLIICSISLGISTAAFWTFSIDFIESTGSYSDWSLSMFWITIGIFGILGGFSGMCIDRFGLPLTYRWTSIAIGLSSILVAVFPEHRVIAFSSAALFGISYILITGLLMVWGIRVFVTNASLGIGTPFLLLAVGQVIGSLFAGMLIDGLGFSTTFVIYGLFGFFAMVLGPKKIKE